MHPVKAHATRLFAAAPIERHPLFAALAARELTPAQVRAIALQIFHVVDAFPRLLAAVLCNVPDWRLRMCLVENLWEEHGRGDPARVHVETYRAFLHALGIGDEEITASRPGVAATIYLRAVRDLCIEQPYPEALAALGAIEEVVARASPLVSRYAIRAAGIAPDAARHFGDHETLDIAHADELYDLAARIWDRDPAAHVGIERGVALGLTHHRRLYSDLISEV